MTPRLHDENRKLMMLQQRKKITTTSLHSAIETKYGRYLLITMESYHGVWCVLSYHSVRGMVGRVAGGGGAGRGHNNMVLPLLCSRRKLSLCSWCAGRVVGGLATFPTLTIPKLICLFSRPPHNNALPLLPHALSGVVTLFLLVIIIGASPPRAEFKK